MSSTSESQPWTEFFFEWGARDVWDLREATVLLLGVNPDLVWTHWLHELAESKCRSGRKFEDHEHEEQCEILRASPVVPAYDDLRGKLVAAVKSGVCQSTDSPGLLRPADAVA